VEEEDLKVLYWTAFISWCTRMDRTPSWSAFSKFFKQLNH